MTSKRPIDLLLVESEAFKSLSAEHEILQHGGERGWHCCQGYFYTDAETGKTREVDVVMKKWWEKKEEEDLYGRVTLVIEVKSIKDYHLLFSPYGYRESVMLNPAWLGNWMQDRDEELVRIPTTVGLSAARTKQFFQLLNEQCFPEGFYRISDVSASPPSAANVSSAFRETNPAKHKDLDNSVLWRAVQSLQSALTAMSAKEREDIVLDISTDMEYYATNNTREKMTSRSVERYARDWTGFHPIVVVDSPLWMMEKDGIKPIPWCRFLLFGVGMFAPWADIVHRDGFSGYMDHLTKSYMTFFEEAKARSIAI